MPQNCVLSQMGPQLDNVYVDDGTSLCTTKLPGEQEIRCVKQMVTNDQGRKRSIPCKGYRSHQSVAPCGKPAFSCSPKASFSAVAMNAVSASTSQFLAICCKSSWARRNSFFFPLVQVWRKSQRCHQVVARRSFHACSVQNTRVP